MSKCKDKVIITIGRTYGSGAKEIGKKVAVELGIPLYDKELLEAAARASKIDIGYLNEVDEKKISSFLYSELMNYYAMERREPLEIIAQDLQVKAIKNAASQGSCVIIGRRADKILRNDYDILSVFVSAPIEDRITRVSNRDGLTEKESRKVILKSDRVRQSYYNAYGEGEWGEAANYKLCIDSGDLGVEGSAAMILQYLKLTGKLDEDD